MQSGPEELWPARLAVPHKAAEHKAKPRRWRREAHLLGNGAEDVVGRGGRVIGFALPEALARGSASLNCVRRLECRVFDAPPGSSPTNAARNQHEPGRGRKRGSGAPGEREYRETSAQEAQPARREDETAHGEQHLKPNRSQVLQQGQSRDCGQQGSHQRDEVGQIGEGPSTEPDLWTGKHSAWVSKEAGEENDDEAFDQFLVVSDVLARLGLRIHRAVRH